MHTHIRKHSGLTKIDEISAHIVKFYGLVLNSAHMLKKCAFVLWLEGDSVSAVSSALQTDAHAAYGP